MAAGRPNKGLARRRTRGGSDDEDDDGQLLAGDSQSEGSVATGVDEQEDSLSEGEGIGGIQNASVSQPQNKNTDHQHAEPGTQNGKSRKQAAKSGKNNKHSEPNSMQVQSFKATADTEAMMHGLSITDKSPNVVDFEASDAGATSRPRNKAGVANGEQIVKQRREHEEYKKKRDADPAFIPNRGNFFMHDTRGQPNGGPAPFRGGAGMRGGRGRAGMDERVASTNARSQNERTAEQVWKHDLHAAINEEPNAGNSTGPQEDISRGVRGEKQVATAGPTSFSSTQLLGRIQLRVLLPGMAKPITYSEVPAMKYVRLPDHRPPLRRDKPVRIFLPKIGPRYIFPATERSFIFIPRQMRPNHRGFANLQQRSIGGNGYSSRRTSMYGGSMYSASIAPSRRSSIARDREGMFSPASYVSGYQPPHRPVVRLPHNGPYYTSSTPPMMPYSGQHTPIGQIHTYPLPQQPAFQGTPTTTVQHPRPQKAISVSGIESPAMLHQQQPSADQQAFHGQLPTHLGGHSAHPSQGSIPYDLQQQQFTYAGQATDSPLSRIPENGMHAGGFQPPQQMYYPPYGGAQQGYYYPQMAMSPMYAVPPGQQHSYAVPMPVSAHQPMSQPLQHDSSAQSAQASTSMVAHESNGMVFYMPATEAAAQTNTTEQYQPAEGFVPTYAAPGLPPTPAPDQSVYYYMPNMANNMGFHPSIQHS